MPRSAQLRFRCSSNTTQFREQIPPQVVALSVMHHQMSESSACRGLAGWTSAPPAMGANCQRCQRMSAGVRVSFHTSSVGQNMRPQRSLPAIHQLLSRPLNTSHVPDFPQCRCFLLLLQLSIALQCCLGRV